MIEGKTILAVIPARGGSKGVLRKNTREVAGKPLIAWTIEAARKSRYIDRLIVSSDDPDILDTARRWGCEVPFVRPAELAQDRTPGIDPVIHAITFLPGYHYVLLLQPTSPLRGHEEIDSCIELCLERGAASCVSVTETDKSPYWMFTVDAQGEMHRLMETEQAFHNRQDLPKTYVLNGAIYFAECEAVVRERSFLGKGTVPYVMTRQSSVDIDTELDLTIAQVLLQAQGAACADESSEAVAR